MPVSLLHTIVGMRDNLAPLQMQVSLTLPGNVMRSSDIICWVTLPGPRVSDPTSPDVTSEEPFPQETSVWKLLSGKDRSMPTMSALLLAECQLFAAIYITTVPIT
uniref:Uncharacterized protein n=1 Tax=Arundo donax TaxID=35708 RepID=A0A0A9AGW4_ARUDO